MKPETKINFWCVIIAIVGIVMLRDVLTESQHIEAIPYSEFSASVSAAEAGKYSASHRRATHDKRGDRRAHA